jgi:hypothetical protein
MNTFITENLSFNVEVLQRTLAKEAWQIVNNPEKVSDPTFILNTLSALGICDENDLLYCEEKELKEISATIKKVPRRRFLQIFGLVGDDGSDGDNSEEKL